MQPVSPSVQVWPYLEAERAAYRFRIINAANARAYNLSFICASPQDYPNFPYPLSGTPLSFYQVLHCHHSTVQRPL